ncbi:ATP-dependent helicase HrpB [Nocardioides marinquilinus]|uniref:ATP-dependent helicase HrpB n=1 Tax=Nocardioides marinquilinus TaxID=1210400 RepID=A0ABP9PZE9_9ACTN
MTLLDRLRRAGDLPVAGGLARLAAALDAGGTAVVQAPPGSGKTTLVPPAVADGVADGGRVVVTQPRRIAARAAAARLAHLLGEPVGATVGYAVRGERRVSDRTRVEFVTAGLLVRRLQSSPDLPGVAAVVLDEVHERSLDADLALALTLDVRGALRDDLRVVAMSATVEAERFGALLGGPVVDVPGALHLVKVRYAPLPPGARALDERGVTRALLDHVSATARQALAAHGDVLVFVPGAREVDEVARRLSGSGVAAVRLHGRLPAAEQDAALRPAADGAPRVVVSTAVAETSLTVPGVRAVVDAGLSREPRHDHRRGLGGLVTVTASRAAADQRAGRAGREAPGAAYRCWGEAEHAHRPAHPTPEIAAADLTGLALELAAWGDPDGSGLALPDPPPGAAFAAARGVLHDLGAVDDDGRVTTRGRALAAVPTDPRLARALLDGAPLVGARRAAEVVALLADDRRPRETDLTAALRAARRDGGAWRREVRRLEALVERGGAHDLPDDLAAGAVVALAHPERVARSRGGGRFVMVGGTGAVLPAGDPLAEVEWLAVADVDRRPGDAEARVRVAAPLTAELALDAASARLIETDDVRWRDGRVRARRVRRLGAVELASTPVSDPAPALVAAAVRDAVAADGVGVLPWPPAARALRTRLAFLHEAIGDPWPDVSDVALADVERWLVVGSRGPRPDDVLAGLRGLLPWPEAAHLDELAPERITVPSGRSVAVDYEAVDAGGQPVLAVKLQECFGWTGTPRLAGGRVPLLLHLLSPAGRPAAVTADLASFWASGYAAVRAELRGRYPKHPWPDDPTTAPPRRGTTRSGR